MIQVFIADDHKVLIDGIMARLTVEEDMVVVGYVTSGKAVLEVLSDGVDVLVLDLDLPELDGLEVCKQVQKDFPHVKVLILSMHDDRKHIASALKAGAKAYVLKEKGADELILAIRKVYAGELYLSEANIQRLANAPNIGSSWTSSFSPAITRREKEVLKLIGEGFSSNEIAEKLYISLKTVESHRANLLDKLNVKNAAALVRAAMERGLI